MHIRVCVLVMVVSTSVLFNHANPDSMILWEATKRKGSGLMSRAIILLSTLFVFLSSSAGYAVTITSITREEKRSITSEVESIAIETKGGSVTWTSINENESPHIVIARTIFGTDLDAMEDFLEELRVEEGNVGTLLNLHAFLPENREFFPFLSPGVFNCAIHLNVYASPELIRKFRVRTHNGGIEVAGFRGELDLQTHNGDIQITEFLGNLDLETHNGSIKLEFGEGEITLRTHNGRIDLGNITLNGSSFVRTYNGRIEGAVVLSLVGNYIFEAYNGNIDLQMPRDTEGSFELRTRTGSINFRLGNDVFQTKENTCLVRGQEPSISITTYSGDIVVREVEKE